MTRLPKLTAALLAASFMVFSAAASADFTTSMTHAQIEAEMTRMLSTVNPSTGKNYTLIQVAESAKLGGLTANVFTTDAVLRGSPAPDVVTAALTVWGLPDTKLILDAAVAAAPGQLADIQTAALSFPGVDPTIVAGATGAGGIVPGVGGAPAGTPAPALGGGAGPAGGGGVASPA